MITRLEEALRQLAEEGGDGNFVILHVGQSYVQIACACGESHADLEAHGSTPAQLAALEALGLRRGDYNHEIAITIGADHERRATAQLVLRLLQAIGWPGEPVTFELHLDERWQLTNPALRDVIALGGDERSLLDALHDATVQLMGSPSAERQLARTRDGAFIIFSEDEELERYRSHHPDALGGGFVNGALPLLRYLGKQPVVFNPEGPYELRLGADQVARFLIASTRRQVQALGRPATMFEVGGFRPTHEPTESWLGRVFLWHAGEEPPVDADGDPMVPFAQLYLPTLPFVPAQLRGIELLTVFVSPNQLPAQFEPMGRRWMIREYRSLAGLERDDDRSVSRLVAFPLRPHLLDRDYPVWASDEIPADLRTDLVNLKEEDPGLGYDQQTQHAYGHKLGGCPSFCQSGVAFGDGYEFVLQISSDAKIGLNVVDGGSLMFARHPATASWALYYDFH